MRGLKFVSDLAVSGTAVWNRVALTITGRVTLKGAASGHLRAVADQRGQREGSHHRCRRGQAVALTTRAP